MGDIPKYLDKYQELCSEQLTYLSQRMAHRIALDREIDELFEKAKQDYTYVHNILERAREEDNAPQSVNPKNRKRRKTRTVGRYTTRPVLQMTPEGKVVQQFPTLKAASLATGILAHYISIAARTKSYTRDGSYWMFLEDYKTPVVTPGLDTSFGRDLMAGVDVTRPARPDTDAQTDADAGKADADKASTDTAAGSDDT